jgi:hypothetical protein
MSLLQVVHTFPDRGESALEQGTERRQASDKSMISGHLVDERQQILTRLRAAEGLLESA